MQQRPGGVCGQSNSDGLCRFLPVGAPGQVQWDLALALRFLGNLEGRRPGKSGASIGGGGSAPAGPSPLEESAALFREQLAPDELRAPSADAETRTAGSRTTL